MRLSRVLALGASVLVLLGACSTGGGSKPTIKIGSDGFDEARVMAEVYAQALEANGYTVDRAGIGLGAAQGHAAALESGQIDLKPEYIGRGLAYYDAGTQTGDPAANAGGPAGRAHDQGWRDHRSSGTRPARTRTRSSSARRRPTSTSSRS